MQAKSRCWTWPIWSGKGSIRVAVGWLGSSMRFSRWCLRGMMSGSCGICWLHTSYTQGRRSTCLHADCRGRSSSHCHQSPHAKDQYLVCHSSSCCSLPSFHRCPPLLLLLPLPRLFPLTPGDQPSGATALVLQYGATSHNRHPSKTRKAAHRPHSASSAPLGGAIGNRRVSWTFETTQCPTPKTL